MKDDEEEVVLMVMVMVMDNEVDEKVEEKEFSVQVVYYMLVLYPHLFITFERFLKPNHRKIIAENVHYRPGNENSL